MHAAKLLKEVISHAPAETESLGEAWGRGAQRGFVIALTGDLGAGKTQLVRGLARGLGFPDACIRRLSRW